MFLHNVLEYKSLPFVFGDFICHILSCFRSKITAFCIKVGTFLRVCRQFTDSPLTTFPLSATEMLTVPLRLSNSPLSRY